MSTPSQTSGHEMHGSQATSDRNSHHALRIHLLAIGSVSRLVMRRDTGVTAEAQMAGRERRSVRPVTQLQQLLYEGLASEITAAAAVVGAVRRLTRRRRSRRRRRGAEEEEARGRECVCLCLSATGFARQTELASLERRSEQQCRRST